MNTKNLKLIFIITISNILQAVPGGREFFTPSKLSTDAKKNTVQIPTNENRLQHHKSLPSMTARSTFYILTATLALINIVKINTR